MVNDNAIRVALRNALMEQDAYGVADLFQLPSISENSTANQPSRKQQQQQHTPQSLIVDEVDYGGLLASLLDAIAAAEVVSCLHPIFLYSLLGQGYLRR